MRLQSVGVTLVVMLAAGSAAASSFASEGEYLEGGNPAELGVSTVLSEASDVLIEDMKGGLFGEGVDVLCSGFDLAEFDNPDVMLVLSIWPLSGSDPGTGAVKIPCTVDSGICGEAEAEATHLPWRLKATSGTRATFESGGSGEPGWKVECNKIAEDECVGKSTVGLKNVAAGMDVVFDATTNEKPANCSRGGSGQGLIEGEVLFTNEGAGGAIAAAETWLSRKNVAGVPTRNEPECIFSAAAETCQIEFDNITTRTLAVTIGVLEGVNAGSRYAKVKEGCVFNLGLGSCTDEIEVKKIEGGVKWNDYCLYVEDKGTKEPGLVCAGLKM
ncbi:MAG TPA: hypothetical protein VFW38_13425 [Solirubrobacteraceae bacterium]|nr:hypothetical protein [Solirubrobacteraceae bacterium]